MKVINKRQNSQMRFVDIPYGTVFLDSADEPKMKVSLSGHDYIVKLKTGEVLLIAADMMVTLVDAVLTIS